MPEFNDRTETEYNSRVAGLFPSNFALMDADIIQHGGGRSRIEFCDLFADHKDIIHIKKYGSASMLSHLFSQGLVSGELFQMDSEFRRKVNEKLPSAHRLSNPDRRPRQGAYQVIFGVISSVPGDLVLPFFSRLNMKHAVRRLQGFGYRVTKAKIPVAETLRARERYEYRGPA
jgi:uncharacterized protein (TIGR04141 family)